MVLLTFDATTYFGPQSQFISMMIGVVITIIYVIIIVGVYYKSRGERKLWKALYEAVKSGKVKIDI